MNGHYTYIMNKYNSLTCKLCLKFPKAKGLQLSEKWLCNCRRLDITAGLWGNIWSWASNQGTERGFLFLKQPPIASTYKVNLR